MRIRLTVLNSLIGGAPKVMNLGTGTPQFPYVLEQAMMPIGRAKGAAFASAIFVSCVAQHSAA
jgi:hypothetical protein